MEPLIALLVLGSAALHPLWNLLLKYGGDPQRGYLVMTATIGLCGLFHALAAGEDLWAAFPVWPLILMSWCGQLLYGTCLTATLRRGDLSTYYPIIRASPVFVVVVSALFLGQSYAAATLAGIAMAVGGGFLLLYRRGTRYFSDPGTLGLALLAMAGTGIYSLADSRLMQSIAPPVQMFWVEALLLPAYAMLYRFRRDEVAPRETKRRPAGSILLFVLPGIIAYVSYIMILLAYQLGGEVAAVTSVRQASIPLSVLLGGYFLREGATLRRLMASLLLAAGIVVIVTAG
ncbi:MAG: hypothetical protein ACR2RA_05300 [Geminicoccaceae bacterium]